MAVSTPVDSVDQITQEQNGPAEALLAQNSQIVQAELHPEPIMAPRRGNTERRPAIHPRQLTEEDPIFPSLPPPPQGGTKKTKTNQDTTS